MLAKDDAGALDDLRVVRQLGVPGVPVWQIDGMIAQLEAVIAATAASTAPPVSEPEPADIDPPQD